MQSLIDRTYSLSDRRRTELPRKYEPKQLNPLHHEILRRALLGDTHKEIATALNCTVATVSNAVNSGLGRDKLAVMTAVADTDSVELAKRIRETAPKALEILQEILDSEDINYALKFKAATDILDRAGHSPVKKLDVRRSSTELSIEEIETLKHQAIERAQQAGITIDVTPIDASI